jgi:NAD(P)-dependent dehydrogenase (short-subunit alcohol dehydrogenase family)
VSPGILRPGVLAGRTVVVAGGADGAAARCAALGAAVHPIAVDLRDEDAVEVAVRAVGPIDVLVADAAAGFAAEGGGIAGLRRGVDGAWNATRAVARAAWIEPERRPGTVLLLAPAPDAGEHAGAAAAALENTARTLSTEWARYGIVTTAVRPGPHTAAAERDEIVAFLASPAGAYYSGCAFTLR